MTILAQDIKLRASKTMADVPEGGGGPSAQEIGWGESNTVFDDIDSVSRTLGNVSIRQVHMHVDTPNTDRLLGAYAIVAKLPQDPNVSVTLAECAAFAKRSEISTSIADYLIRGVRWNGYLLENHVKGQANIQIYQRVGTPVPTIGRTLVLVLNEGLSTEVIQYIRVIAVESSERTFTDQIGDFKAQVVKCDLQSGLAQALPGSPPSRFFTASAGTTVIRDTSEADAANYYGAAPLTAVGTLGSTEIKVSSVYSQLVPSSSTAVPNLDQRPAAQRLLTLATAPRLVETPVTPHTRRVKIGQENRGLSYVFQLTPLPEPGTVTITWVGLGNRQTVIDDGAGALEGAGAGTVSSSTGSLAITLPSLPDVGSAVVVSWGARTAYTNRSSQGAQVRAPEYVFKTEKDGVEPGSVSIGWTSGGTVRTATDNGSGQIAGDASGVIDYPTGTIYLRPAFMPDAGGQFAIDYQRSDSETEIIAVPGVDAGGFAILTLAQQPAAGTVSVSWSTAQEVGQSSGATMTADSWVKTANAGPGSSGGGGIGPGWWGTFAPTPGSSGSSAAPPSTMQTSSNGSRSVYTRTAEQASTKRVITNHNVTDDGVGGFTDDLGTVSYGSKQISLRMVTFDRTTASYKTDYENSSEFANATATGGSSSGSSGGNSQKGGAWGTTSVSDQMLAGSSVVVRYKVGVSVPTNETMTYTPPEVVIDLCPYTTDRIVPSSVQFSWMGTVYQDVEGIVYRGRTSSSPGIVSGTMNYAAGVAIMNDYVVGGSATTFALQSLWTQKGDWKAASTFFMTNASPIQPGQITITLLDVAGTAITVDADLNGNLSGDHAMGKVDFQNGLAELQFGDFVLDSGLTAAEKAEWWYDPGDVGAVQAGKIWRPWPIDPASLRYNTVSNFYLPIDPDILGLDPVRLPQDGRVPIYRKGRILFIGHNATIAPTNYSNGATIDCGRTRLSHVWLIGADGKLITTGFTADEAALNAGEITVTDVSTWVQPVTVEHRIQDMALCTDVQINGTLKLNIPLSHDFPVGSVVSSALLFGLTYARIANLFDQHSWDGITWADAPVGNVAVGSYNDTANPVLVTNAGALGDRFAMRFASNAADFDLISEHMGTIATGNKNVNFNPINPIKPGTPIFTLAAAGWGGSWVAGNTVFLKLSAAIQAMALIRTVQPGTPTGLDYSFDLLTGGDVDRPPSAP
ncbi:hypothetical protein [Ottowia sp. VDI28]|uniref:hypothetical protein n=1 Tax=Ottowia sp. VDI28 TaxID=3133968 RepID=UPI003C2CEE1C